MRSVSIPLTVGIMATSVFVSACDTSGIPFLQSPDSSQHSRATLKSKRIGLQNTQMILAESTLASAPTYVAPTIKAVGFSSIAVQQSKNLNQRRLMAIRAARLDAYRVLSEQIHGVQLDGQTTVAEAILTSDVMSAAVRGTIMGAETVKIEPSGQDTYSVELSISQTHVDRLIKLYKGGLI
ncbi:LPP20 family lipoprotein [Planktomarina temperata]|nr:LPP20 family lipoprotein [Planktomarina temperata]MDC1467539.1 LPP20 family lipoprotein [Planktomarina temperata]